MPLSGIVTYAFLLKFVHGLWVNINETLILCKILYKVYMYNGYKNGGNAQ